MCLYYALVIRFLAGGKLEMIETDHFIPHFVVLFGEWGVHYKAPTDHNPDNFLGMIFYNGVFDADYFGEE